MNKQRTNGPEAQMTPSILSCLAFSLKGSDKIYDFLCINICRAPREMLKPEPEIRGCQLLLKPAEGPGRCLCIKKICLNFIIANGNVLTCNNVQTVSKHSIALYSEWRRCSRYKATF